LFQQLGPSATYGQDWLPGVHERQTPTPHPKKRARQDARLAIDDRQGAESPWNVFAVWSRSPHASGMQLHPGQLTVSTEVVRQLVGVQFPQWRGLPVRPVASHGTVHAIFRVVAGLVARFPLQPAEVASTRRRIEAEMAAASQLIGRTRFRTPEPVAIGEPGAAYPLPWSVQTWLPGAVATEKDPSESIAFAHDLAEFVDGIRGIDTEGGRFDGTNRGGDLRSRDAWMEECFQGSEGLLDVVWLRKTWQTFRSLPRTAPDAMTHGDLIPGNLLVADGRLTGVLDVGDMAPADPALDLVGAWHVLATGPRKAFRAVLRCDDLEWARGTAWAFEQALGAAWYYANTNPTMSDMGRRTLSRIAADPPL
jgi:aminoglycoside phosphotransferase (APT) family kinase protein